MEIIKDEVIRNKWHRGFERKKPIKEIVIHGSGGGGTYQWVLTGGRKEEYKRGISLFHYLIEQDGKTIEIIDPERWVYHSSSGKHDETTIGIENLNPDPQNKAPLTEGEYKSLFNLIDYLMETYPTINRIVGHDYNYLTYSGATKGCPGNFTWSRLEEHLTKKKIKFKKIADMAYEVTL